ncbi:MAG TPA: GGDEF domain-containing protein [Burkholderiaceae bacterium]|nr:GGDEF domain-containing protein [Burkholderiaceae bacterium]
MSSEASFSDRFEQTQRRLLRSPMLALQFLGAAVMLVIWAMETHVHVITPWDLWLLPLASAIVAGSAALTLSRPALEVQLRAVPVATFNLYLVMALHGGLLHSHGEQQWYSIITTMLWVPLGYGSAFVFLRLRAALLVSGLSAAGIFAPLLWMAYFGALPEWMLSPGPLLTEMVLSQAMFVVLLTAVVRLRSSHDRATADAQVLRELAGTDVLTDLPNRREMDERLTQALALCERKGQPLSVAIIDVDRFKSINDRFGHSAGDAVLKQLGRSMRGELRTSDVLGRWGGEEFLLFTPGTDAYAAAELADRMRTAVQRQTFAHHEAVTVSIGVSQWRPGDSLETLLQRADSALYLGKTNGRNRVELLIGDEADVAAGGFVEHPEAMSSAAGSRNTDPFTSMR